MHFRRSKFLISCLSTGFDIQDGLITVSLSTRFSYGFGTIISRFSFELDCITATGFRDSAQDV
jgi:hypothetical protein